MGRMGVFIVNLCDYGLYSTVLVNCFLNGGEVLKNINCKGNYSDVLFCFVALAGNCLCK